MELAGFWIGLGIAIAGFFIGLGAGDIGRIAASRGLLINVAYYKGDKSDG
jgi:hypothetical protein